MIQEQTPSLGQWCVDYGVDMNNLSQLVTSNTLCRCNQGLKSGVFLKG